MKPINNERGAVLVVALIIMGILMVIGTVITMTASTELKIARNEKLAKTAFYQAEGGRVLASSVLQSAAWGTDMCVAPNFPNFEGNENIIIGHCDFFDEDKNDPDTPSPINPAHRDETADVELTGSMAALLDIDKVSTEPLPGGSAEFGSGYEGAGKSGSVMVMSQIDSISSVPGGATSRVLVEYRLIPQ